MVKVVRLHIVDLIQKAAGEGNLSGIAANSTDQALLQRGARGVSHAQWGSDSVSYAGGEDRVSIRWIQRLATFGKCKRFFLGFGRERRGEKKAE